MNIRAIFGDVILSNRCELEAETWWSLAPHEYSGITKSQALTRSSC